MGAWIETHTIHQVLQEEYVAPHVGAWIETTNIYQVVVLCWSHPMWVRGLKLIVSAIFWSETPVAPHVGAWIETLWLYGDCTSTVSRTPCGCVD